MKSTTWTLALSSAALKDYQEILAWTLAAFGEYQAKIYATTIVSSLQALREGPHVVGAKWRPELGEYIASLHVARNGYKGRHLVIFRAAAGDTVIEVLRLLHDSMDLQQHPLFTDAN